MVCQGVSVPPQSNITADTVTAAHRTMPGTVRPYAGGMATDLTPRARARKWQSETRLGLVRRARQMNRILAELYPDANTALNFASPFQLLVATVLSAQTTDVQVNLTTPKLFATYPTPEDLAAANPEAVEQILKPTGFYRAKT